MKMLKEYSKKLKNILISFDEDIRPISDWDISSSVNALIQELPDKKNLPDDVFAEHIAFEFREDCKNKENNSGDYFGPSFEMPQGDLWMVFPSKKNITSAIIEYWKTRAKDSIHPVLKNRYADLAWTFEKEITGNRPNIEMAKITIDSAMEVVCKRCHEFEIHTITKLRRALELSLSIKDKVRSDKVRDSIIAYEEFLSVSGSNQWGFSYDILIEENNCILSDTQKDKIIMDLEKRVIQFSGIEDKSEFNPFSVKAAALRLAHYYKKHKKKDELKRILLKIDDAFNDVDGASAILSTAWLQEIREIYHRFEIHEESERVAVKIQKVSAKIPEEMESITAKIEIPQRKFKKYIEEILGDNLETALNEIICQFIPSRDEAKKQFDYRLKNSVLSCIISKNIVDHEGRTLKKIPPAYEDLESNLRHETSQSMNLQSPILRVLFDKCFQRYLVSAKMLADFIYKSPIFDENDREIIEQGLQLYFEGKYSPAIHVLIPQIERAIRNIVKLTINNVLKENRSGELQYKLLHDLLADLKAFNVLPEKLLYYFQILLTDSAGWNLRNIICHGMVPGNLNGAYEADRVIHVFLCLSKVRIKNVDKTPN